MFASSLRACHPTGIHKASFFQPENWQHPKRPRQHQLFQNLIEVANEVKSSNLDSAKCWTKRFFLRKRANTLQVHESLGRVEGQVAYLGRQKGIWMEFQVTFTLCLLL